MHRIHHISDRLDEIAQLSIGGYQRRCNLQYHEISAANLTEYPMVAEEAHHQHLPEHRRMNPGEGLKRDPQPETARRPEFNGAQQSEPANIAHHLISGKARP